MGYLCIITIILRKIILHETVEEVEATKDIKKPRAEWQCDSPRFNTKPPKFLPLLASLPKIPSYLAKFLSLNAAYEETPEVPSREYNQLKKWQLYLSQ